MVNSATGEAAPASMATVFSSGAGSSHAMAEAQAPRMMDQGMGLENTPLSALRSACRTPASPCPRRDSAMHSELVITMSMAMVRMTGPALASPSSVTSSGTPMKPELGKAATKAPKAASFQPQRVWLKAMVPPTISRPHSKYTPAATGSISCVIGVCAPKRYSMQGSAKYSTKVLSPGMAANGSTPRRVATKPHSTRAKKGKVTARMDSTGRDCVSPVLQQVQGISRR